MESTLGEEAYDYLRFVADQIRLALVEEEGKYVCALPVSRGVAKEVRRELLEIAELVRGYPWTKSVKTS